MFKWLGGELRDVLGDGIFTDFLVDGVIAGVGAVMVFLPQILLLFLFLGFLEDCGYLARVAYLMDRIMRIDEPARPRVRADAVRVRVRGAGDHRDAHDGAPPRSHPDDDGRAADDVLGAPAGLHADHRAR